MTPKQAIDCVTIAPYEWVSEENAETIWNRIAVDFPSLRPEDLTRQILLNYAKRSRPELIEILPIDAAIQP